MAVLPFALVLDCSVVYEGRAYSSLDLGKYLVLHKPDGSIAVHGARAKPLNYQNGGSDVVIHRSGPEFDAIWQAHFDGVGRPKFIIWSVNKGETLIVGVYGVGGEISELSYNKIRLHRSERQLVGQMVSKIGDYFPGLEIVSTEMEVRTPYGSIDILVTDSYGEAHLIEAKRALASVSACGQVARYAKYYREECGRKTHEYLASPRLSANARLYCEQHGQTWLEVDFDH